MSTIIVAGDVHLGSDNANVKDFNAFLEDLYTHHDSIEELVLLGDLWDMIRRDPFGVAWETTNTLYRIKRLAEIIPVSYIIGNHDLYLTELDGTRYEVDFLEQYTLEQAGVQVHFRHGHEFDRLHSNRLSAYLSGPGDLGDIDPTRGRKDPIIADARDAIGKFKQHLRTDGEGIPSREYHRRERRAHDFLRTISADKLVYGHTHAPYVHHENLVANPGSWKASVPLHNTYVEISEGNLSLYRFQIDCHDVRVG